MIRSEFLNLIEELVELDPGALRGSERLAEIDMNSLAVIGFIALVDERFGVSIPPRKIANCSTVDDLAALLGDQITVAGKV